MDKIVVGCKKNSNNEIIEVGIYDLKNQLENDLDKIIFENDISIISFDELLDEIKKNTTRYFIGYDSGNLGVKNSINKELLNLNNVEKLLQNDRMQIKKLKKNFEFNKYLIVDRNIDKDTNEIKEVTIIPCLSNFDGKYVECNKTNIMFSELLENIKNNFAEYFIVNMKGFFNEKDSLKGYGDISDARCLLEPKIATIENVENLLKKDFEIIK